MPLGEPAELFEAFLDPCHCLEMLSCTCSVMGFLDFCSWSHFVVGPTVRNIGCVFTTKSRGGILGFAPERKRLAQIASRGIFHNLAGDGVGQTLLGGNLAKQGCTRMLSQRGC